MSEDAHRLEVAYLDAMLAIVDVIGVDEADVKRAPTISFDTIPESALAAGRMALKFLVIGAGILDPNCSDDAAAMDSVEDVAAAWARQAGA